METETLATSQECQADDMKKRQKQVKFHSYTYISNYIEETEDGQLIEHAKYKVDNGEIIADVLEERKHTFKLQLPDGNIIIKRRKQVEEI